MKLTAMPPTLMLLVVGFGVGLPIVAISQTTGRSNPDLVIPSMAGRDLFVAYCSGCHGLDGKGDGRLAPTLTVPPPDLTALSERNHGKFPDARVEAILKGEEPPSTAHRMNGMPIWGAIFKGLDSRDEVNEERIQNLVKYLKSIQPRVKARPAPARYANGPTYLVLNGQ